MYPDLSGEDVIVEEFVSGVWLFELLAAVENDDRAALAKMAEQRPGGRGPLHPANIIVQADNELVFIEFAAMGALSESRRAAIPEILQPHGARGPPHPDRSRARSDQV